jgi:anaerobic selenocysteine-containing dehydrogenase
VQSISPPVVGPRNNSRHSGDVILELARILGGPVSASLPFASFEEYLRRQVEELFDAQVGSVFTTSLEETWNRLLERSGWWAPTYSNAEELWLQIKEQGGWWVPTYYYGEWERFFQTSSGRFEFFSQTLALWAGKHPDFARRAGLEPDDDRLFMPHQPPLAEAPADFQLLLLPIETLPLAGGSGAHLPYLQQIAGPHLFAHWESWLEINPHTAHRLGIGDGDTVWVESRRGRAKVRARLYEGARPDVVHLPLGYGHTEGSEWAQRGVNPLSLLEEDYDPVAGLPQTNSTYVKVYRS